MNFEQARQYAFTVLWKTTECFSGPDCWCRIIVPIEPIYYSNPESDNKYEYSVVDAGALDQTTAEYIVKLHNEHHERVKQSCRDAMQETIQTLVHPHDSVTVKHNPNVDDYLVKGFEKLWENKQSKIGKIVRKEID